MLKFNITHQESYSRGELLLRSFFGWLYIGIPHFFLIFFYTIWVALAQFVSWWIILFTGKTPTFYYNALLGLNKWTMRVGARLYNLADGYPSFGPSGADDKTELHFEHIHIGRGQLLLRSLLGWLYAGIPHMVCLYIRFIATFVLIFLAWWVVLFTGKYPAGWHKFVTGSLRWMTRLSLYLSFFLDKYPPFNGAPDQMEAAEMPLDQVA
ncbi:MAG: DUF4389 domain-containing protein [Chitinophagales bacterium]